MYLRTKPQGTLVIAAILAAALTSLAQAQKSDPQQMIVIPYEASKARFEPLYKSRPDGPQISLLRGDPRTGPSSALIKLPRNYGGRFHYHSANYQLFLLEGTMRQWSQDQTEANAVILTPGGYRYQPAMVSHADNCYTDYCVALVIYDGPVDTLYPQ